MYQFLAAIAQPGSLLFALVLLSLPLAWWRRSRRLGIWLGSLSLIAVAVIGVLPLHDWLLRPLEDRYPVPELPAHVDGIVVLGGAERPHIMAARGWPELNSNADRLVAFAALARRYPEARLVFTGGSAVPHQGIDLTEADVAGRVLGLLGLDPGRITFEREARNTAENARNTATLIQPKAGEVWLLITSARHMPRAMGSFAAVGWAPVPFPVDYQTGPARGVWDAGFSPLSRLAALDGLSKEWLGLLGYWLRGDTRALVPPSGTGRSKP
jgi:uncharacterized SAM-binding protein YcdF (DUF218 family)